VRAPEPVTARRDGHAGGAIARILAAAGVRRVYTVPGESFLELLDAVEQHPELRLVSTRHESGAAFMAEADAKLTGAPAVATGTRGVGAANLAIGVHTAFQDSTPMLVLLGQVDTEHLGKEAFQEVDLTAFFRPIAKWAVTVHDPQRVPDVVATALVRAVSGRPGPVVVALPADVLAGRPTEDSVQAAVRAVRAPRAQPVASNDTVAGLADLVMGAERPVSIVGVGARPYRDDVVRFAERYGVGVYAAFRRQDAFPSQHAHFLGHLTLGTPAACLTELDQADLVLVLGSRLDEVTTQSFRLPRLRSQVVHVDADSSVLGMAMHSDWSVVADVGELLRRLNALPVTRADRDWTAGHDAYLAAATPRRRPTRRGLDPALVVQVMRETLPPDSIVTNDAGNFSAFLHAYWPYAARSQLGPISGAMGYGVPAGVAAALAEPERTVVAVAGDGGFSMSGFELETAIRHGAAMTVIVFRNGLYGTIAMHQQRTTGRMAGVAIGDIDVAGVAEALGARGVLVEDEATLRQELRQAGQRPGVTVLDVVTDPELISPSAVLSELGPARVEEPS
jgi:acetolactate synthase I/II/III large subunit